MWTQEGSLYKKRMKPMSRKMPTRDLEHTAWVVCCAQVFIPDPSYVGTISTQFFMSPIPSFSLQVNLVSFFNHQIIIQSLTDIGCIFFFFNSGILQLLPISLRFLCLPPHPSFFLVCVDSTRLAALQVEVWQNILVSFSHIFHP